MVSKMIAWTLKRLGLATKAEARDPDLPKRKRRAEVARRSALAVQYELHRRGK